MRWSKKRWRWSDELGGESLRSRPYDETARMGHPEKGGQESEATPLCEAKGAGFGGGKVRAVEMM